MQMKGMQHEELTAASESLASQFPEKCSSKSDTDRKVESPSSHRQNGTAASLTSDVNQDEESISSPETSEIQTHANGFSFDIASDFNPSFSSNNLWPLTHGADEMGHGHGLQFGAPAPMAMQSYNNNNSFNQPLPFGSIGQPSYLSGNTSQFSSGPGVPPMHMVNNIPMNASLSNYGLHPMSQNQNQRRAITAQHNYSSMGPKSPRFPWGNHQSPWPSQQQSVSPWTVALQQQKALSRGSMSSGFSQVNIKKSPQLNVSQATALNNLLSQSRVRRSSPVSGMMMGGGYKSQQFSSNLNGHDLDSTGINYQDMRSSNNDCMRLDALMGIMRNNQFEASEQPKGFAEGFDTPSSFSAEDGPPNYLDQAPLGMINGISPFAGYRDHQERYSRKVFVGGLPPDIDEDEITTSFRRFGPVVVDWPHKAESKSYFPPKGYCFLLFQEEISVQELIENCFTDDNKLYWCVTSPTMKDKPVQIRPWNLSDSDFVMDGSQPLDPRKTIFVGGVPRPLRAVELAMIIDRLYGGVCYAGIDTDPELKYPKGAGRVAFSNQQSYIAAISARFVQLQHGDIDKRVEVKPYVLDDQMCDECQGVRCNGKFAPFFCANITCLQYYCEQCWATIHSRPGREYHKPLVKEGADRPRAVPFRWC